MNALTQPTNFGAWCELKLDKGIRIIGDDKEGYELSIDADTLNAGWRWLVQSCARNDGKSCIGFLSDNVMDEMTDGYVAKKLIDAMDVTGSDLDAAFDALQALREARCHYVMRRIECHKSALVHLFKEGKKPDAIGEYKKKLEDAA
jgi:hypothetical protein